MGFRLQAIVDRVRRESRGLADVDLAKLNMQIGLPLSRTAREIRDDPALVARAELICEQILRSGKK
jgi:hypothetical protein